MKPLLIRMLNIRTLLQITICTLITLSIRYLIFKYLNIDVLDVECMFSYIGLSFFASVAAIKIFVNAIIEHYTDQGQFLTTNPGHVEAITHKAESSNSATRQLGSSLQTTNTNLLVPEMTEENCKNALANSGKDILKAKYETDKSLAERNLILELPAGNDREFKLKRLDVGLRAKYDVLLSLVNARAEFLGKIRGDFPNKFNSYQDITPAWSDTLQEARAALEK